MPNPAPTPTPDWAAVAAPELARFDGLPHAHKMRATVLALVTARVNGVPEATVWDRASHPDVCSKTIYQNKWRRQPLFASVLANVEAAVRLHQDTRTLRALQSAAERLALASEDAAAQLISLANRGLIKRTVTDADGKDHVFYEKAAGADILRAVLGLLDRAGVETAQKGSTETSGDINVQGTLNVNLSDTERSTRIAAILDAARARRDRSAIDDGPGAMAPDPDPAE